MSDPVLKQLVRQRSLSWEEGKTRTVTFVVTEDCQLRCKYCYVVGKNQKNRMNPEVARATMDYLLADREIFKEKALVIDFIGGEPFLEIDLIDEASDHFKRRAYQLDHPWFSSYRFSFSTNGLLYDDPRVQRYIDKNRTHVSIGITIDGTRRKHDLQRVYPDGRGSYDDIVGKIPLWLRQFPNASTKVTVSHDDIPYIKESVLHLWSLGIPEVNINVVFENVWQEGDDLLLEEELRRLADEVVDQRLYREHTCSFFGDFLGKPMQREENQNWCGGGRAMLAVDCQGNFYPCNRFLPFTLSSGRRRIIGTCFTGIDSNKLRPFYALDRLSQSTEECIDCDVATGCAWCCGYNYDVADSETVYQRAVDICRMHKARVRANGYYWDRLRRAEKAG
jgi:uncharacterized protein